MLRRRILALVITFVWLLLTMTVPKTVEAGLELKKQWSPFSLISIKSADHRIGRCTEIRDKRGQLITETSRQVMVGDEVILPNSKHYKVIEVNKSAAVAKFMGFDQHYLTWVEYFQSNVVKEAVANWSDKPVGIYHTHTGESYIPSSGEAFEPYEGDIYQVGQSFIARLEKQKVNVIYYHTPHDPHDSNAYMRSRRTAIGILKNDPVAIFDIHRDGVPDPNKYRVTIEGQQVAKVRLVIGKQNPNSNVNRDFAKRLMAYAEQLHPGIVKDLYIGRGNYNQDLLSTAVLLEAGTHTNTLDESQRGMALFADAIPVVLGLGKDVGGAVGAPIKVTEKSGWNTVIWLLVITVVAVGTFLFISTGSMEKAVEAGTMTLREVLGENSIVDRLNLINKKIYERLGVKPQFKPLSKYKDQIKRLKNK